MILRGFCLEFWVDFGWNFDGFGFWMVNHRFWMDFWMDFARISHGFWMDFRLISPGFRMDLGWILDG